MYIYKESNLISQIKAEWLLCTLAYYTVCMLMYNFIHLVKYCLVTYQLNKLMINVFLLMLPW